MKKKSVSHEPARIRQVKLLGGFDVELKFADGVVKTVKLKKYLRGPAFEQVRSDPKFFAQVFIDPIGETIMWPNEADIDADLLRYDLTPAWMERAREAKRRRPLSKSRTKTTALIPKRIYLSPKQLEFLDEINPNPSVAIREIIDTFEKQRIPLQSL